MGPWDALIHLGNFFLPALAVALFAALGAKLLWWRELKGVGLARLWAWPAGAGALVLLGGLLLLGRDGKMLTYGALCVACAAGLWWAGWGPGRR
jgi:hypothetical protein